MSRHHLVENLTESLMKVLKCQKKIKFRYETMTKRTKNSKVRISQYLMEVNENFPIKKSPPSQIMVYCGSGK